MSVTSVGTAGANRSTSASVSTAWGSGQNRTAGNLLVAVVGAGGSTVQASAAITEGSGNWKRWLLINDSSGNSSYSCISLWTKVAAGGDAAPTFSSNFTSTNAMAYTLFELNGANNDCPIDVCGTGSNNGSVSSLYIATPGVLAASGEFAISAFARERAANTYTGTCSGTGFTNIYNDGSTSSVLHFACDTNPSPSSGSAVADQYAWSGTATSSRWAGFVVSIAPAAYSHMVVSATTLPTGDGDMFQLLVLKDAVEAGGQSAHNTGAAKPESSITPAYSNSLPLFVVDDDGTAATFTAEANNGILNQASSSGFGTAGCTGKYTGTVTQGSPITVGCQSPTTDACGWAVYEVPPAAGTQPSADATSPSYVDSQFTTATVGNQSVIGTAGMPPDGSVLVALVASDVSAGTPTCTMADSLGLTWTQRSAAATTYYGAFIYTATVPTSAQTYERAGGGIARGLATAAADRAVRNLRGGGTAVASGIGAKSVVPASQVIQTSGGGMAAGLGTGKPDRAIRNLSGGACTVAAAISSRAVIRFRAGAAAIRGLGSGSGQWTSLVKTGGGVAAGQGTGLKVLTLAGLAKAGGGVVQGLGSGGSHLAVVRRTGGAVAAGAGTGRADRAVQSLRAGGVAVGAGTGEKVFIPAGGEPGWTHAEYLNGTSQETNFATASPPQGSWFGDDFGSFDFSGLPADATIMGLSVTLRVRESGTANVRYRVGPYLSGVPLATIEDTGDQPGNTDLHFLTFDGWDTLPTAAQLKDPGFAIRCEFSRTDTTAVTGELCWIGITASIRVPSTTKFGGGVAAGAGTGRRQGPVRDVVGGAAARGAGTGFADRPVRNLRGGGLARGAGAGAAAKLLLPHLVNKTVANPTSSTSLSVTIPATTAHDCLVVCVSSYNTSATATVSGMTLGGAADHFAELVEDNATTPTRTFIWADPDCAGGQTALVISGSNLDCSSGMGMVTVYEFSTLAADIPRLSDRTDTSSGTGTSWTSGTTPATSDAVEVWVGMGNTAAVLGTVPGAPWVNDKQSYTVSGYQITSSTGTAVYAGTCESGEWTGTVVTLRQPLGTVTHAVAGGGMARGMGAGRQAVVSPSKTGGGCAVAAGGGAAATVRGYAESGAAMASGAGGGVGQVASLFKRGGGIAAGLGSGRWAGPRIRAGGAAAHGLAGGVLVAPGARIFARNGGAAAPGLGSASAYSTGWVRAIMADSLVLGDIELLGGGVASTNPACPGAVFRLLPGYDPGAPQPTTDFVASLLLDGERPFGRRASNRTIKLPIWIIATDRDNLAAAREHLESTVDQDLWITTWTRDRDPNDPLPLLIDCFRGEPTVVTADLQWEQHLCMKITVTIPAMPYARSDKQLKLRFASPVPTGPPPPPSPVVIDNFETITASTCYQHTAHVVGPHSVCWDPDDDRVGDPGGQSSRFEYSGVLANSMDLTGMTSVSMYLGFGTRYYHHLPFHGRHQAVTVELTLTDTSGNSISMSRSHLRLPVSRQYSSPVFSKVTIPLKLDDPVFAYASLQGYTLKVSNHHWAHEHHLRWVTLYLDALTAYPDSQTATPVTKAGFYTLYGVQGTARTAMSLELQQPPSASTATTVNSTGGGNYTVPVGTAWLKVAVLGGGGAGGSRTTSGMGGGGGGAEYAREDLFPVVEGEVIPYKVGAGGTAGASPVNGGDTYFGPGSASSLVVTAHGGSSAAQDSITGAAGGNGSANTVAHPGGAGRTATGVYGGGGGSSGGTDLPGNTPLGVSATSFTATGTTTWTCPVGVTQVYAECWGSGGSGATGDGNDGQGGGGGEYAAGYVNVTPGNGYTVVVALGGSSASGTNQNGNSGGSSSFTGNAGAQILAHGGIRGLSTYYSGAGGAGGSGSTNAVHYNGGTGGSAQPYSGGGGSSASPSGPGNPGNGYGTPGSAPTDGGAGGAGSGQSQNNGNPGVQPGGGGGGTYGPRTSGAGGNGRVRLTYPGGAPDQNGATAVAGGGAGGNGGATGNSVGSAGSQPGGGGGGANSAGSAEAGGAGGAGRIVITPYASQAWKSVILHRPPRGARKSVQPVVSVGNGADAPDGTHWYTMPQGVSGVNALFEGTYTVYLIASSWNGTGSRTVTATVRQVEYSGGPNYSVTTAGVTFTPSQVTNGILCAGVLTLPVREIPPDNTNAYFQVAVTDTNTSDRFWDCLFLDTMGQTVVINEPSSGYLRYFVDAPDANTALGRFMGSQSDRLAAVSVLQNTDALSGGPLTVEPADQDNTLLAYCPDGSAPAIGVSYFPAWYFDRIS